MARVVWKYIVPFSSVRNLCPPMPLAWNARPAMAGLDPESGFPAVWVITEDEAAVRVDRMVLAFATGEPVPDDWEHWGSMITADGFVWHVFAEPAQRDS